MRSLADMDRYPVPPMDTASDSKLDGWPLHETTIEVGAITLSLQLIDQDYVIDRLVEEDADLEQRNPYFGLVWPSAIVLARQIEARTDLAGKRVLDIGCGPGLLGIVAARKGAHVTFLDLMPEGVALAKSNAARCGVDGAFVCADIRDESRIRGRFDLLIASDVLYERPLVAALLDALDQRLTPNGIALFSDPTRPTAHGFAHEVKHRGFIVDENQTSFSDDGRVLTIRTFLIRLPNSNQPPRYVAR